MDWEWKMALDFLTGQPKLPTDTPPNKITEITEQNNNDFSEIECV